MFHLDDEFVEFAKHVSIKEIRFNENINLASK